MSENDLDEVPRQPAPLPAELHLQDNNVRTIARDLPARIPLLEKLHSGRQPRPPSALRGGRLSADSKQLKLLFLSRNHLSSIPFAAPHAGGAAAGRQPYLHHPAARLQGLLSSLRRLVLDGNLLANQRSLTTPSAASYS